jgi:hypothetical protein
MSLTVSVDTSGLEKKILEKSIAMKKSLGEALKEEGGLLAVSLVKYTQPFGTGNKAKAQGESAILRDVTEAFYVLPDQLCSSVTVVRDGLYAGYFQIFAKKNGTVFLTAQSTWHVPDSVEQLQAHHNQLRNRDGRVRRDRNKIDRDGALAIINLWVITQSQFAALMQILLPRVGFAKGGWATVARKLGRSNSELPGWVKNHTSPGSVIDNTDAAQPSLTIINEVNYTGRVLSESAKKLAIQEREVKIGLAVDRAIKFGVRDK